MKSRFSDWLLFLYLLSALNSVLLISASAQLSPSGTSTWTRHYNPTGQNLTLTAWRALYGTTAEGPADSDNDNVPDLVEFLHGSNPTNSEGFQYTRLQTQFRQLTVNGISATYLTVTVSVDNLAEGVEYHIETSTDLTQWNSGRDHFILHQLSGSNNRTTALWRSSQPGDAETTRFVRLAAREVSTSSGQTDPPEPSGWLDPEAYAYACTTGITVDNAADLSEFLKGLDTTGLRSNLVEAWLLQSRFQPLSGTTAFSVKGLANLAITGAPARQKQGIKLANDSTTAPSVPQYLSGTMPATTGDVTIVSTAFRSRWAPITGNRADVFVYRTNPVNWAITGQYGANYSFYTFNGSNFKTSNIPARSPAEVRYRPTALSNAATAAADSVKVRTPGFTTVQTTGHGSLSFEKIAIGRTADNGASGWKSYSDGIVPFVLIFNSVLDDAQLNSVHDLINRHVHKRYRVVIEGDSMSSDSVGLAMWIQDRGGFFGSNMDLVNLSAGGQTSTQMVSQIGTSAGIHDQGTTSVPVICTIWTGQNDRAINGGQTHLNCRTLWAAAKARGMKVVAFTITKSSSITNDGWEANRQTANTLIRADAGQGYYDYLVDADEFLASIATTDPYYNDETLYSAADKVHLNSIVGGGNSRLLDRVSEVIRNQIP